MRLVQTTEPARAPILLEEVKAHLRIDGEQEDAVISGFLAAAISTIETTSGLSLVDRNIVIYADSWADLPTQKSARARSEVGARVLVPGASGAARIMLPVRPVGAILAILLIDESGAETEWASSNYIVQPGIEPALQLTPGSAWPKLSRSFDAVKISATAGFGPDWNAIPELIQQAIIKVVANLYLNRGDEDQPPMNLLKASGAEGLLSSFRKVRL